MQIMSVHKQVYICRFHLVGCVRQHACRLSSVQVLPLFVVLLDFDAFALYLVLLVLLVQLIILAIFLHKFDCLGRV